MSLTKRRKTNLGRRSRRTQQTPTATETSSVPEGLHIPGPLLQVYRTKEGMPASALLILAEIWRWRSLMVAGKEPKPTVELERVDKSTWRTGYGLFKARFGFSKRTAERSLGALEQMGFLRRSIRDGRFDGRTLRNSVFVQLLDSVLALPGMTITAARKVQRDHSDKVSGPEEKAGKSAVAPRPNFLTASPKELEAFFTHEVSGRRGRGGKQWQTFLEQDCPASPEALKALEVFADEYDDVIGAVYLVPPFDQAMDRRAAVRLNEWLRKHPTTAHAMRRAAGRYLGAQYDDPGRRPRRDNPPLAAKGCAAPGFRFSDFVEHVERHSVPPIEGRRRSSE